MGKKLHEMSTLKKNIFKISLFIVITASILPIFIISWFNHPGADDFNYSYLVHHTIECGGGFIDIIKSAFDTTMLFMQKWQGLYSSAFLLSLQPAVFNERLYMVTPFIITGILFTGIHMLFHTLCANLLKTGGKEVRTISFLVIFYLVQCLPSPVEGLYWYNGAVNYLFFLGLALVYLSLVIRYIYEDAANTVRLLAATVLSFLISGGNHITSAICILTTLCLCIISIIKNTGRQHAPGTIHTPGKKYLVFLPALSGIWGFYIMYTAPGTAARQKALEGTLECQGSVYHTLKTAFGDTLGCCGKYFNLSTLFLLILITPAICKLVTKTTDRPLRDPSLCPTTDRPLRKRSYFLILLLFDFAILSAMICVPLYSMGKYGSGRILNSIFIVYTILLVLTYSYGLCCLSASRKISLRYIKSSIRKQPAALSRVLLALLSAIRSFTKLNHKLTKLLFVLMTAAIGLLGNDGMTTKSGYAHGSTGVNAAYELISGNAKRYDDACMERLEAYNSEDLKDVRVPAFASPPPLLFFDDITEDSSDWRNRAVSKYYHKASLQLSS